MSFGKHTLLSPALALLLPAPVHADIQLCGTVSVDTRGNPSY